MIEWQSALLGGIGFIAVLALLYWIILKTTSLGDDEYDTEGTEDRLEMGGKERHRRVGFRHRVSKQTPMTKAFLVAVVIFVAYLAVAIYRVAATGSPGQMIYADYVELGIFGSVCIVAGVIFKAKQEGKAGELEILLEQSDGNDKKTVRFDRSMVRETGNGSKLVPELKESPVFGLFWRPMLVADDPELRDADHRLPDDLVMWEVPTDESAVWDELRGKVTVRAKDTSPVNKPNRSADYEIVPSDRKSKREIREYENTINELEEELRNERINVSILSENLNEIEAILTNEEDVGMRRLQKAKEILEPEPDVEHHYDGQAQNGRNPATSND